MVVKTEVETRVSRMAAISHRRWPAPAATELPNIDDVVAAIQNGAHELAALVQDPSLLFFVVALRVPCTRLQSALLFAKP